MQGFKSYWDSSEYLFSCLRQYKYTDKNVF